MIDPRMGAFYMLTGVTFMTFASGFGVCLFNMETVGECVEVANSWLDVFIDVGNHIIMWAIAIFHEVFKR